MVLRELEADEHFERRPLNSRPDFRIGQRIDRCIGIARLALARDLLADIVGQRRVCTVHIGRSLAARHRAFFAIGEIERDGSQPLRDNRASPAQDGGEIGQFYRARAGDIAAPCNDIERRFGIYPVARFVAGRGQVRHRRGQIEIGQRARCRAAEQRDVAGIVGNAHCRTGRADCGDARAAAVNHQFTGGFATCQRKAKSHSGQEAITGDHVGGIPHVFVCVPLGGARVP